MRESIKDLQYFINKPVTIITRGINRNFNETQSIDYFTGICEKITTDGVLTKHPITNCKNFLLFSSIVGIFEEQQLDPDNPEHKTLINEIKEGKNINLKKENNELDIDSLNTLLER